MGPWRRRPTPAPPCRRPPGLCHGAADRLDLHGPPVHGLAANASTTIAPLSNNVQQASFSSQNTARALAEQINVSATVSLAFDLFSASDTVSFSDQWQSSTNSSNQYYNFYSLYTLNSTVPQSNPLNEQGLNAGTSPPPPPPLSSIRSVVVTTCHRCR